MTGISERSLFKAYGFHHCSFVERRDADAWPCPELSTLTYFDVEGVAHGWCPKHTAVGITEAAWHKWVIAVPVVA